MTRSEATETPIVYSPFSASQLTLVGTSPLDVSSRPSAMARGLLEPGSNFGVYVVGSCIGEGGMARIYQAEHAGLRRQVALKVLIDGFARDPDGRERFLREARIAAAIKHPNVVNIFDVGVHEDIPYLVMELLEGTDLETLLEEKGALDEGLIVDIMVPVVAGLSAVHDAGIVHRDLKPGNIFLARGRYEDLEPKLLDFGISKAPGPEQMKLTTNGMLMGTPFYMSPEGLRGAEMTPLSDQYSLGVVMYECATGCTPFAAPTFADVFKLITAGNYKPPGVKNPEISKRLARIITRAMSLDPAQRFKDLREMGRELLLLAGQRTRITWGLSFGELRPSATLIAGSPGALQEPSRPAPRARLRRGAAIAAFALAPVVLVGASLFGWPASNSATAPAAGTAVVLSTAANRAEEPKPLASPAPSAAVPSAPSPAPAEQAAIPTPEGPTKPKRSVPRGSLAGGAARPPARGALAAEAEWMLPAAPSPTQSKPSDTRPALGANGAPILD